MNRLGTNGGFKRRNLKEDGFSILPGVIGRREIENLIEALSKIDKKNGVRSRGGVYAVRNLLKLSPIINELAYSTKLRAIAEENLAKAAFPVRGILFDKNADANWLVPWHQDLTICVVAREDVPGYGPWR